MYKIKKKYMDIKVTLLLLIICTNNVQIYSKSEELKKNKQHV